MAFDRDPEERSIAERCDRLTRLIRAISPPPPNHLWFLNKLAEIKVFSQKQEEAARYELEGMIRDLRERPDGTGGFILSAERYQEHLD